VDTVVITLKAMTTVTQQQAATMKMRVNSELTKPSKTDKHPAQVWVTQPELRGPTLIEAARNTIADLRSSAFAHSHHQPGSCS